MQKGRQFIQDGIEDVGRSSNQIEHVVDIAIDANFSEDPFKDSLPSDFCWAGPRLSANQPLPTAMQAALVDDLPSAPLGRQLDGRRVGQTRRSCPCASMAAVGLEPSFAFLSVCGRWR